jgi:acyl-coenzyme A synthetase/AMP-(fatty) acid ligase
MLFSVAEVSNDTLEKLTVPELIDYYLEHHPDETFAIYPGEKVGDELCRISYLEFARATHRCARAMFPDAPAKEKEVIGVIVNADSLMWITAIAGIIRAGHTVSTSTVVKRELMSNESS